LQNTCYKFINILIKKQIEIPDGINIISEQFIDEIKEIDTKLALLAIEKAQITANVQSLVKKSEVITEKKGNSGELRLKD
jgi:hypothetical protein